MLNILLIGGTNGGKTIEVEDGVKSVRLSAQRKGFQRVIGDDPKIEEYFLGDIADSLGDRHAVFVCSGDDPIRVLLNHYQNGR